MLWAVLGLACVAYTIFELVQLRKVRGRGAGRAASGQRTAPPPAGAPAPDVQFGDVEPPAPPVTLDRRTRHDPYLAQLKRRATDR
jgi:hypothetical protein